MTADDFAKIVREGNEKLRVDDILIKTGDAEFHGKGMLRISKQRIEVDATIASNEQLPDGKSGIFTKRDSWKVSGLIEDHLQFRCDYVGPVGNRKWFNGRTTITLKLHPIELIPSGWDAMTRAERADYWTTQNEQRRVKGEPLFDVPIVSEDDAAQFHAILVGYPLISHNVQHPVSEDHPFYLEIKNSRDRAFVGELEKFRFGLFGDKEDLHVHLRSKARNCPKTDEEDWTVFYGFMRALSFTHGVNAWPYRVEYWRNGQKLVDRITDAGELPKSAHAPFTERMDFDARTGALKWDLGEALRKATSFFEGDSVLSNEVSEILHLFRVADSRVNSEITTLAMCTLLENLMHVVFKGLNLRDQELRKDDSSVLAFENAKKLVSEQIAKGINDRTAAEKVAYQRLLGVVQSTNFFSQRGIFQRICSHLGLKWEGNMESAFDIWTKARHPLVHNIERANQSEEQIKNSMLNESRLAGIINIVILKLMGYSGWMRESAFEDKYREI